MPDSSDTSSMEPALPPDLEQIRRLRAEAAGLLDRLEDHRRLVAERQVETGRTDPISLVTGASSIDRAMETTRLLLARMDSLLASMDRVLDDAA